jgi:hypothetical protein
MYSDDIVTSSWFSLQGRCKAKHTINDGNSVEFSFRSGAQGLDLAFDAATLDAFVRQGMAALHEMAELRAANRRSRRSENP